MLLRRTLAALCLLALAATPGIADVGEIPAETAVNALSAAVVDGEVSVTGGAAFGPQEPQLVGDFGVPSLDGFPYEELGLELVEAYVGQPDPGTGDLLLRLVVSNLPEPGGVPEVGRYFWDFGVTMPGGGTAPLSYDGRYSNVARATIDGDDDPMRTPHFVLEGDCEPNDANIIFCEKIAPLDAVMDAATDTIDVTVPLELVAEQIDGDPVGQRLVPFEIFQGIAAAPTAYVSPGQTTYVLHHDEDYTIAGRTVDLQLRDSAGDTVAAAGASVAEDGAFDGTLDAGGLPGGDYVLTATACFGSNCGSQTLPVTLP